MLMEQHHLETKCSRPPKCRRPASDRKDNLALRWTLQKAKAFCGDPATSTAAIESLQRADSVHALNSYFDKLSGVQPAQRLASAKTKPAQNFQMRGKLNFQMRWKFRLNRGYFPRKISTLALAGAGGIEPPNGGIKIRCLTAWLRPNRRRTEWPENWPARNPSGRSRSIGSGAAFQPPGGAKYHPDPTPRRSSLYYHCTKRAGWLRAGARRAARPLRPPPFRENTAPIFVHGSEP